MSSIVALSLVAGLLSVDHRVGWQSLLAQPVFAAVIVGGVTGELESALAVGLALELVYLSILPMRGTRLPDQIASGVVGCGTASLLIRDTGDPRFVFVTAVGILMGLLAGELGSRLGAPFHGLQNRFLSGIDFASNTARRSVIQKIAWLHTGSVAYAFLVETVLVLVLLSAGIFAGGRFTRIVDATLLDGAGYWRFLLPAVGAASLIHLYWQHHLRRMLIVCSVVVVVILWLM